MIGRHPFVIIASAMWSMVQIANVAQAQQSQCREEVVACESSCVDQPAEDCRPVCRSIVVCEIEHDRLPESRLPSDSLPESRLPKSRLPESRLPDSSFN